MCHPVIRPRPCAPSLPPVIGQHADSDIRWLLGGLSWRARQRALSLSAGHGTYVPRGENAMCATTRSADPPHPPPLSSHVLGYSLGSSRCPLVQGTRLRPAFSLRWALLWGCSCGRLWARAALGTAYAGTATCMLCKCATGQGGSVMSIEIPHRQTQVSQAGTMPQAEIYFGQPTTAKG